MNSKIVMITLLSIGTFSLLKSECAECQKLREEIVKITQYSLKLTGEIRLLTDSVIKHSQTVCKMSGTL